MHLIPFDCKHAEHEYSNFYNQTGAGSIPIFSGAKTQVGYGLGGIFGSLLKAALPVIKKGALSLGKTALKTGINVARDGLEGRNIRHSLGNNFKTAGKDILANSLTGVNNLLLNNRHKRKRQRKNRVTSHKSSKRRRSSKNIKKSDIFNQ